MTGASGQQVLAYDCPTGRHSSDGPIQTPEDAIRLQTIHYHQKMIAYSNSREARDSECRASTS